MAGNAGNGAPRVSVVVATRNRAVRLRALLGSLREQTLDPGDFEIVVVDDRSDDETSEVLRHEQDAQGPSIQVVPGRGMGPASARNDGWRASRGSVVAFTDDDCEATPQWLEEALRALAEDAGVFVQGRTEPLPRERELLAGFARTKRISELGPWYQTCNMVYPRALLERLEGFDERFGRPFGEDADLAWRAIETGATPRFAPEAVIHHAIEPWRGIDLLLSGLRDPDEALAFRKHPGLLRSVRVAGVFKARSHALLLLAAAGVALSGRSRWALVLTLPYARLLAARCLHTGPGMSAAPYLAGHDLLEAWSATRGSLRHRVAAL
jgi:glycosyltransferase involved in cell wall biosynthesis